MPGAPRPYRPPINVQPPQSAIKAQYLLPPQVSKDARRD